MVSSPSPPKPPSAQETAAAQTGQNVTTAVAEQAGNLINQSNPYGSLSYNVRDTYELKDPNSGDIYDVPLYEAVTEFTPEGQRLSDLNIETQTNLGTMARDQSGALLNHLSTPLSLENDVVEQHLFDAYDARMAPVFDERKAALEAQLASQGIALGSDAYHSAMDQFGRDRNDAYTQAQLAARGQALKELMTERNQPINEIGALLSGSQVQQPNFVSTPSFNLATVDYAGLQNQQYQNELARYNASGTNFGGLFSLGAAGLGLL